jgi:endonuclease/exonuclease/phosphatase family metal-dependent hydrolase
MAPFLNPANWWFAGFMGLLYPYLFFLLVFFFLFFLFMKSKWGLVSLVVLFAGWKNTTVLFGWNYSFPFLNKKKESKLRVMDWNVRRFVPYHEEIFRPGANDNEKQILQEIKYYQPDVICMQEFYSSFDKNEKHDNIELFKKEVGYPYYVFSSDYSTWTSIRSGTIIFSKYPIVDSAVIKFPNNIQKTAESLVYADIVFNGDTLRVYSMHLQSFGFLRRDYEDLGKIKNQKDSALVASRNIFRKMKMAFSMRGQQADFIRQNLAASQHPKILCGDLNDVPNSYAYFTIKSDMNDAFLEKGKGWGKTFISPSSRILSYLPTLRIDYILTDPEIRVDQFDRINRKLSDHMGLVTDLTFEKK